MISAFNKRIEPKRVAGLPEPVFFAAPGVIVFAVMAVLMPIVPVKIVFAIAAGGTLFFIADVLRWYDYWLIRKSMERGKERKKLPSWGGKNQKTYVDGFTWQTRIGDHGLIHQGPCVSVAIEWAGVQDRHWSSDERQNEHRRRVALLRTLSDELGLSVENHLVRERDSSLADAYLRECQQMHRSLAIPPIVQDVREQLVQTYRPLARTNRVFTVLCLAAPRKAGLMGWIGPQMRRRNRTAQDLYAGLMEVFKTVKADFPGAQLMSSEDYQAADSNHSAALQRAASG